MKNEKMIGAMAIALTVMMILTSVAVIAAPPQPYTHQGVAKLDGTAVSDGMQISAWADGVQYATNDTYNGDGTYKLNVPGNDPDITDEKDGADDGELLIYWMYDGSNWYIANENDTFTSGGDTLGDLSFSSSQPDLVKIWEIAPDTNAGTDFIWIAAPQDWDNANYSIKTDNWSGMDFSTAEYKTNSAGTWSAWYMEVGSNLSNSDDLELVWTDASGAIANGNPVVIDRVEYGTIGSEPSNTIMPNAAYSGTQGKAIERKGTVDSPQDTNNCTDDFQEVDEDTVPTWVAQPVYNLWVEKSGNDAILHWDDANSPPGGYNVYSTTNPLTSWNNWTLLDNVVALNYTHAGAVSDADNHFYIVRATDGSSEGGNSSMAFVAKVQFTYYTNFFRNWQSIPYSGNDWNGDGQITAFDIVTAIEGGTGKGYNTYIDAVANWDASTGGYGSRATYNSRSGWQGDFSINPGDGIALEIKQNFTWVVNATDKDNSYNLTYHTNFFRNWISVPYTIKDYNGDGQITAFDIVTAIEGGTGKGYSTYISAVANWDASSGGYGSRATYNSRSGWQGDFSINPGDGIALEIKQDFTMNLQIITPEVTQ